MPKLLIHLCLHIGTFFVLSLSRYLHATIQHFLIASSVQIINDGSPILDKQVTMQQHYCSRRGRFLGRVCDYLAYIFVYRKPAVNADEENKSINWVYQFKTESFVDHLFYFCLVLYRFPARMFIDALWSPAGKGLASWLSFVMSNCEVVTFQLVPWVRCGA